MPPRRAAAKASPAGDTAASNNESGGGVNAAPKTDSNGLPTFGFVTTPAATQEAATATAASAPAAAVPIAGLAVAIASRARAGSNQFDISLTPPELGRIDVQLNVDGNGQVTTHMTVDRPETLALLQNQQPQLQSALEQAGLTTADSGMQFSLRDQSFTGQNGSGSQWGAAQVVIPEPELTPIAATQIYGRAGSGGGIDIRV